MLNVLLESRSRRTRRIGSTVTSALVHAGLIAGAVALTLPKPVDANSVPRPHRPDIKWVSIRAARQAPATPQSGPPAPQRAPSLPTIAIPSLTPTTIPPIDVGPVIPPDQLVIGGPGVRTASPIGGDPGMLSGTGSIVDERFVDRAPRVLGRAPEPRYPAALREAGVQGRVVVQFVVDTLGRAELDELQVVESAHGQFVESVRAALARYRFTVGEAGGRKVRTRVQIPFDFTLVR